MFLYAVDYTGAIDNFNESQFWPATQWINCENRDVMEGIVFMEIKFKEAGMKFKCFHNWGHPERWSARQIPDFNALERVAVLSCEIAERFGLLVGRYHVLQEGNGGQSRTEEEGLLSR
jgi:hypothetical protein